MTPQKILPTNLRKRLASFVRSIAPPARAKTLPGMEPVYQRLFERDLAACGIENNFYPVGSAASYGLMYATLRIIREVRPKVVVELGAGQTSLLLDRLNRHGLLNADVLTIEHDPSWAARIGSQVSHEVRQAPLRPGKAAGIQFVGYDIERSNLPKKIQMLVVDGPPAGNPDTAFARLGCLELLDHLDPEAFAVVVDDAERHGEALLADTIRAALAQRSIPTRAGSIVACKRQDIVCGGRFESVAYF